MSGSSFGTIAQLLYAEEHPVDFIRLVEELHLSLSRLGDAKLPLRWEGADLACFDLSSVRIVLGIAHHPASGHSACLTVAVESSADRSASDGLEETCMSLVDHVQRSSPALDILWYRANQPLTTHLHDRLVAGLPGLTQGLTGPAQDDRPATSASEVLCHAEAADFADTPHRESSMPFARPFHAAVAGPLLRRKTKSTAQLPRNALTRSASADARAQMARGRSRSHFTAPARGGLTNDVTEAACPRDLQTFNSEFARVRDAFTQIDPEPPAPHLSTPLRLATHALNASLILVWPPLGAAVMAHSLIRGENTRLSGYLVVMTGLFGVAFDTTLGQYVAAMAGV